MKEIASVGAAYVDINAPSFPIPAHVDTLLGTETVGGRYEMVLGGSAVNFARFCKKLGINAVFIGKTGRDRTAHIITDLFQAEGITPALSESLDKQTNMNVNIVSATGQSIMLSFGDANQSLSQEDILRGLDAHKDVIDMLYLGGACKLKHVIPDLPELVKQTKERGIQTVLDHGRVINTVTEDEKESIRQTARIVDYYLPSKDEFLVMWNVSSIEEGLHMFSNVSTRVVVKDAENGAYTIADGRIMHVPAFSVVAHNTVGAGDSFNAGFIAAQLEGKTLEESIRFAHAVAALKISQDHFPSKEEITRLLLQ